jgi:hypothetical protein
MAHCEECHCDRQINNIQLGPVNTEANPGKWPSAGALLELMALKRNGNADELAAMTAYLAVPLAGNITSCS